MTYRAVFFVNGISPALPPKGFYAGIHTTSIPDSVPIFIVKPLPLPIGTNSFDAGSGPVSHHGNIRREAKGLHAGIQPTSTPNSVAVLI
jgi:hypothetical protein